MKFIKVKLPFRNSAGTLKLAQAVSEKHTALGAASPLTGFVEMAVFESRRANAAQLQKEGDDADHLAQSKYHQAASLCGIAAGQNKQTENTVCWFVRLARDVLLLKHRGTEQHLEEYGFNVVISQTGSRKNVRVDLSVKKTADLLRLADAILQRHATLGAGSPLTGNVDMALFAAAATTATTLLNEWNTQRALAQSKHNQALNSIGYGAGQTSQTEGTLYYDLITVRDRLLQVTRGAEEQMSEWGFDVVAR